MQRASPSMTRKEFVRAHKGIVKRRLASQLLQRFVVRLKQTRTRRRGTDGRRRRSHERACIDVGAAPARAEPVGALAMLVVQLARSARGSVARAVAGAARGARDPGRYLERRLSALRHWQRRSPRARQRATYPPSTIRCSPVTNEAPSEQSQSTADAISSDFPNRCIGCSAAICSYAAASLPACTLRSITIGVSMNAGHTALTRM